MTTQTARRTEPAGAGRPARPSRWSRMRRSGSGIALLFVAPYLLLFLIFRIGPTLAGFALSLAKYQITGIVEWRGLSNFQRLFTDDLFWNALRVTVVYTVIAVPLTLIVALVMAQLSARSIRGIRVYRALYFLPVITSLVTSGVIWQWLYAEHGPLNGLFGLLGIGPVPWLSSGAAVLPSLSLLSVWTRFGYDMLILLAGLLAIPQQYTEAAMLDGASAWQRFWHITLPQLKPAMFFVVILEIVQSFQVFDVIYVMTGGGPVRSSYSLVFFVYDQGFHYFDFGYASAAGVVLFAITLIVSLVQRRLFRED
jgi:multiple sugar transport system permease protein